MQLSSRKIHNIKESTTGQQHWVEEVLNDYKVYLPMELPMQNRISNLIQHSAGQASLPATEL
jgi:hypothetical protein